MKNDDTREQLISATIVLLAASKDVTKITSRQIAAEAKTNLAMINYCFKSKEELMNIAIGRMISNSADSFRTINDDSISPREHLRKMLCNLCDITISYSQFTKISVPYILLQEEITHPYEVLPIIKKHFGSKKNDAECRVIAYQMISFMQLVFYRSEEFIKYSGINIYDAEQRNNLIDMQLNLFLGDEK
jgi:AcrR family transcriptional regulator